MAEGDRALALGRPDAAQDRLQAEAVLVCGPDLDREVGTARGLFGNDLVQLFFSRSAKLTGACVEGVVL